MELEFRAFHKEKKIMYQVLLICFVNKYVDVLPDYQLEGGNQEEWKFDEIELMAYTGCKDAKETKIFEGDIVKWKTRRYRSAYTGLKEDIGKFQTITWRSAVEWDMNAFCITESFDPVNQRNNSPLIPDETFEVIGNIYENPEILTR